MLIGEYETKLTDKNRLAIPKKIRDELKEELIIARGYESCLILLDSKRFKQLELILNKKPILNLSIRDTKRFLLGGANEIEMDIQGRFVLANNLKAYAEINEEVVFVGLGDWVEIWDKSRWQKKITELSKNASDIAERLVRLS